MANERMRVREGLAAKVITTTDLNPGAPTVARAPEGHLVETHTLPPSASASGSASTSSPSQTLAEEALTTTRYRGTPPPPISRPKPTGGAR